MEKRSRTEPAHYERTAVSDLQGAWESLRDATVKAHPFDGSERMLFHSDEGMCWDSVRDLKRMQEAFLLVRNLAAQGKTPEEVTMWVEDVAECLDEALGAIKKGEAPARRHFT